MKQLTWKLVLPLTIMSFATFTKWWYVLPVDGPDTMMTGFPLPFVCPGWHTSMSLQIFLTEFMIDILVFFVFWFLTTFCINRYLKKLRVGKRLTIILLTISGLVVTGAVIIASNSDNTFRTERPWDMEVMTTDYKFIWQHQERPELDKHAPSKE